MESTGGALIRRARREARISQRELARRLDTSQSLIARWERGVVSPTFDAVLRAVRACGRDLSLQLYTYDSDHDRLIDDQLRLSPSERLRRMTKSYESIEALRTAAEVER